MRVALFVTCLTDTFFPRVGEACVCVLRHFGCDVEFPLEQTCCGQPAVNSGLRPEAAILARRMIDVFAPYDLIVCPSASCVATMRHHYLDLLQDAPEARDKAQALLDRTFEITLFLTERLGVDLAALLAAPTPTTYHWPCHARGLYSPAQLQAWLSNPAATCKPPGRPDLCCGFGGSFAIDFPGISLAMMNDKLADLTATGATQIVCNEGGCSLHLSGGAHRRDLPLRFKHIIELLAESLGLMEPAA